MVKVPGESSANNYELIRKLHNTSPGVAVSVFFVSFRFRRSRSFQKTSPHHTISTTHTHTQTNTQRRGGGKSVRTADLTPRSKPKLESPKNSEISSVA